MHVEAGTAIPHHGHTGDEFTIVLDGGYSDASGSYRRGDVQCVGVDHSHRPLVDGDRPCVCLIVARGKVRLRNPLLRWFVRGLPF
jgi:putative transcriptional regulator